MDLNPIMYPEHCHQCDGWHDLTYQSCGFKIDVKRLDEGLRAVGKLLTLKPSMDDSSSEKKHEKGR